MHEQSARFWLVVKYNEKAINIFVAANTYQVGEVNCFGAQLYTVVFKN